MWITKFGKHQIRLYIYNMTFYIILEMKPGKDWYPITEPNWYLKAKKEMYQLKKQNPQNKYKLMKTSY